MYTTPKKTPARLRPHPYASPSPMPMRAHGFRSRDPPPDFPIFSPGGPVYSPGPSSPSSPFPPSSPFTPRSKTPTPRKRIYGMNPCTPPPIRYSKGLRRTLSQSHPRYQPAPTSLAYPSGLPLHLQRDQAFNALTEEALSLAQRARRPLSDDDRIFVKEMERLGQTHFIATSLVDAREATARAVGAADRLKSESPAKPRRHFGLGAEQVFEDRVRSSPPKTLKDAQVELERKRAKKKRLAQEEAAAARERRAHSRSVERPEIRVKVEQDDESVQFANPIPSTDTSTTVQNSQSPDESMQTDADRKEEARILALAEERARQERAQLAAERQDLEAARLRFEAEKEARRREAELEEARRREARLKEEQAWAEQQRIRFEEERMRTEYARMRFEEQERRMGEEKLLREEREREESRRREEEATRARLAAEQEEARQRAARAHAEEQERMRAAQEAFIQAEEEARARAYAEWLAQAAREAEEARARAAEAERLANEVRYHAERERFYQQQQYQEQQRQEQQWYQQQQQQFHQRQQNFTDAPQFQSHQQDTPMRERSIYVDMDASMYSVTEDTPYADSPPRCASPPPPPPPPPPRTPSPPPPPTKAQRFTLYERKWAAIQHEEVPPLSFHQLPWPVLCDVTRLEDITPMGIKEFICDPTRPGVKGKSIRALTTPELLRYHPDKLKKIIAKVGADEQALINSAMQEVARVLILIRDKTL